MSDLMADYELERAQVDLEISQLKLNIKASEFRKMQLLSEMKRVEYNIDATKAAIEELETKIKTIGPQDQGDN